MKDLTPISFLFIFGNLEKRPGIFLTFLRSLLFQLVIGFIGWNNRATRWRVNNAWFLNGVT